MYGSIRSLPPIVVPLLTAIAICGYLVGYHRAPAASEAASARTTRIASGAGILLEYPSSWQPAAAAPTIPSLPIVNPLVLAPGGDSAHAGLLSGQLPADQTSPLPDRFLSFMRVIPHTEVVDLLDVQAYRYGRLSLPGYDRILDLYVIPHLGGNTTALACYASNAYLAYLRQCGQIVAKLTPVGQSQYDLIPSTGYARRLGGLVGVLDSERLRLRREMRRGSTPAAVGRLATALADRFATAGASLAALEPPLVAGPVQAALEGAMLHARDTYRALARAATAERLGRYDAERGHVDATEAGVDRALEGFALLGYRT